MRVLILVSCPRDFGGFHRASAMGRALATRGHDVTVCFRATRPRSGCESTLSEETCRFVELPGVTNSLLTKLLTVGALARHILFGRPDIVHVFASVHPEHLLMIAACRLFGRTCVVDWDDLWIDSPVFHARGRVVRRYLAWAEALGPRLGSAVTVASEFLAGQAAHLARGPILKVPNGVWKKQFAVWERTGARQALQIPMTRLVVLAFGNSYLQGRGKLLIKCADAILRLRADAEIILNVDPMRIWREDGRGDPVPRTLCSIRCIGQIPPAELGKYLAAADFVLFPTTESAAERACFPIRLGSYLNGECPIATNHGDTEAARLVERYGCGIVGRTVSDLAEQVVLAATDDILMNRLRARVRLAKRDLAWEAIVEQVERLYTDVHSRVRGA